MNNLVSSFTAVYPILLMMTVGIIIRKVGMVTDSGIKEMNRLIYRFFFPVMMYANVLDSDLATSIDIRLIVFTLSLITVVFVSLMLIIPQLIKEDAKRGVMVQGIFRSNFLVFGMPIIISLYGVGRIGPATLLAAIEIPYMNGLSVVALEVYRGGRPNAKTIIPRVLKNPIIIGTVLAFIIKAFQIDPFASVVRSLAKVGTPFALVIIGASFKPSNLRKYAKLLGWGVVGKLVFVPIFAVVISVLVGYRNELLITLMAIFGGPCATASYAMAQQMDGDGDLAALLVMMTSVLCVASFFVWIFVLKVMNFA